MHFLYIAPRFHPNQVPIIQGLISKGHTIDFIVTKVGKTEKHDGVKVSLVNPSFCTRVHKWRISRHGQNYVEQKMIFWFIPSHRCIKTLLKQVNPDLIVLRNRNMLSLFFYRRAKRLNIPCLLYNQSPIFDKKKPFVISFFRKTWFSLFPKTRITVCRYAKFPENNTVYIQDKNAFFLPHIIRPTNVMSRDYLENNIVRIFSCGKFRPYKNHLLLVQAVNQIVSDGYTNFRVTILGQADNQEEMDYRKSVCDMVHEFGLDSRVCIHDAVPYDEVPQYYLSHDVFVLSSSSEQATVSVLDSMTYGLATISTSANGTADYITPNVTGQIFKTNDYVDLARKIELYLINPETIRQHGLAALKEANEKYRFDSYYRDFLKVIDRIKS